jgi:hypothetical protein
MGVMGGSADSVDLFPPRFEPRNFTHHHVKSYVGFSELPGIGEGGGRTDGRANFSETD